MRTVGIILSVYAGAAAALSFLGALALVIHEAFVARQWRRGALWDVEDREK